MIINPATNRKVKVLSAKGKQIIADYMEGRITLEKADVKTMKEGKKIMKEAMRTQKLVAQNTQITPVLKSVGSKLDLEKVANFLAAEKVKNEQQGFCLTAAAIADNLMTQCKKSKVQITDAEKEEFRKLFKDALKRGELQLGGGFLRGCAYTAGTVFGVILCCTVVLAPLGVLCLCAVIGHAAVVAEEEHRKQKKRI